MKKRTKMKNTKMKREIQSAVEESVNRAFTIGFESVLHDITYRIDCLMNTQMASYGYNGKVTSQMLNLASHQLDGFTFTDNSPSAGSVAWSDCNIVYKGIKYTITNGNTANKYIYWTLATTPTTFQSSASKPTLSDDDILVCVNNGGIHQIVVGEGRMLNGSILLDGTVNSSEIASGAVTTAKIAATAITSTLLADDAVTNAKIATGAVTSAELGTGAVTTAKLASGAVDSTALASNAVTSGKIASGAVTSAAIAADAVTSSAIAGGAVGTTELAGSAVDSTKLASGAVTSAAIASGAVTAGAIGAGAVATDKLSIATHLLF